MTVTVEAGLTLGALQAQLARHGQWLPIDPPHAASLTIHDLLAGNVSGPRRFGCGTIREHLVGLRAVLADGRVIRNGGKVVKNVAGYDLCKIFVGARGSLGVIVEASFKLRPLPETEEFVTVTTGNLEEAGRSVAAVLESELTPVVLDLHQLEGRAGALTLVVGFAGSRDDVIWQRERSVALGLRAGGSLEYEQQFWSAPPPAPVRVAVPSSRLAETLRALVPGAFIARAGNGVIYHRGGGTWPVAPVPVELMRRVKDVFDPKHILPDLPL
jgi:FAD/FMN-containing dehydrogenase